MAPVTPENNNPPGHTNKVWSGTLPSAKGIVAKECAKISLEDQKTRATELYNFLQGTSPQFASLNAETRLMTALVNLPQSNTVRLIYGLGYGASGIGQTSPTDGKFLALTGEGNADYAPQPFVTDVSAATKCEMKCPSEKEVCAALPQTWPHFVGSNLPDDKEEIMKIAPIPSFLVLDGFEDDLQADEVFERVLSLDDQNDDAILHAKKFLQACMVKRNKNDEKPHMENAEFIKAIPNQARQWATKRYHLLFPSLMKSSTPTPVKDKEDDETTNTLESLLRRVVTPEKNTPTNKDTSMSWEDKLGMSRTELKTTLAMCGLEEGEESLLPIWFTTIAEKGMTDNTRNAIITKQLKNIIFEEAEVPITAPLLKVIRKKQWMANDPLATYKTAAQGLSIFSVSPMSDDEVATLNENSEALDAATSTTAKEIKESCKLKAKVPTDSHEFVELLKTFSNLLYALFSSSCPLYLHLRDILRSLNAYKRSAFKAISQSTKAAVLWIILLQTRHFATGEMSLLAEFKAMKDKLVAKDASISHAEIPVQLLPTEKSKRQGEQLIQPGGKVPKLGSEIGPPSYAVHPSIKQKFVDNVLRIAPSVSLQHICKTCNTNVPQLCKDANRCVLYMVGMCKSRTCQRVHKMASDTEAKHILQQLDKAIQNPSTLKPLAGQ